MPDSNKTASAKPGAVHYIKTRTFAQQTLSFSMGAELDFVFACRMGKQTFDSRLTESIVFDARWRQPPYAMSYQLE